MGLVSLAGAAGGAAKALTEILAERKQAELQAAALQQQQIQNTRADQELGLQRQQESRAAEYQRKQLEDAEYQRKFQRATTIADNAMPGDMPDEATAALLKEMGYGSQLQPGTPAAGAPGPIKLRGGIKYIQSRENREAADARAGESNDLRRELATIAASGQSESRGLRNQLTQMQIDAAKEKQDAAKTAARHADDAVTQYGNDISSVVGELIDEHGNLRPEVAGVVGALDARTPDWSEGANSALAKIDRLISLLDINKLREMKAQSKTGASGFGALSEKELGVLESSGSTLRNRRVGEGTYAAELKRIASTIRKPSGAGGAAQTPAGGGRVYYDAQGKPVQR